MFIEPDFSKNPTFFRQPNGHQAAWFKYFVGCVQVTRARFAQLLVTFRRNNHELPFGTFRVESSPLSSYGAGYGTGDSCWCAYYKDRKRYRVERVARRKDRKRYRVERVARRRFRRTGEWSI